MQLLKPFIKEAIPKEEQDKLNHNPYFQVGVMIFISIVGLLLLRKGLVGIRNKYIVGKWGREYVGATAVIFGIIFCLCGLGLLGMGCYGLYQRFL